MYNSALLKLCEYQAHLAYLKHAPIGDLDFMSEKQARTAIHRNAAKAFMAFVRPDMVAASTVGIKKATPSSYMCAPKACAAGSMPISDAEFEYSGLEGTPEGLLHQSAHEALLKHYADVFGEMIE